MRSIKHDLEEQRSALNRSIKSLGTTRDAEQRHEIVNDPYGAASMTHDDEVAAVMADRRSRKPRQVTAALEDLNSARFAICSAGAEPIAKARTKVMPFATH